MLNFLSKVKGNREGAKNINFINLELVHCQVIINTIIANRCILYLIFVSIGALSHFIDPIAVARKKVITKVMSVVQFFRYLAVFYFPPTKRKIVTKMGKKMAEVSVLVGLVLAIAVDPQLYYPKC